MYFAIDDTYGSSQLAPSRFVTAERRTHVAVAFSAEQVDEIRHQMRSLIAYVNRDLEVKVGEFHFTDIFNRIGPWKDCANSGANIAVFEAFVNIYNINRWPVFVQTVDSRTFADHGIENFSGKLEGFDLSKKSDQSLFLLLIKIRSEFPPAPKKIRVLIDEGPKRKTGTKLGSSIFRDYSDRLEASFASSLEEPLLQIADFVAYSVNRLTNLTYKENRTEFDTEILELLGSIKWNSRDLLPQVGSRKDLAADADEAHARYRSSIGLVRRKKS
ncbi:hypothetical protein C1J03_07550 [Sulfitobacter sp. SK012]|uniref:DUF3800 domain-containing protein n=1 Tax=Sulfitobacter sp. SK012 TaxID=1389005 RepID=UPI000E0AF2B1|nr:DUF3800 domain-containing protein [Sulfitobacter sp. SK012]AXI45894.1 hypothetical protein C1J03_07550 [Sulfitobacter sp. SK012]